MSIELADHFNLDELAYTSNKEYKVQNIKEAKAHLTEMECLAFFAEQVRAILNVPMIITSGYRCDALNKAVGGAKNSQHRFFRAIDFLPRYMSVDEAFSRISMSNLVYKQLIKERADGKEWVHVSMGCGRENLIYKDGKYTKL